MNGVKEQTVSNQVKEQTVTYTRPNGDDVMGNESLIDNIRDEQSRDIIDNCRVGNYDNRGNYVIDADIVKELIGMHKWIDRKAFEKVISENKSEIEFKLTGNIPLFGEMEFRLVVTKFDARLYLIEEVFREGGGYLETYGEKIADYVSDREEKDDLANIFTLFNIKVIDEDDEDEGKKFKEEDDGVDKLLVRKIYLSLLAKNLVDYTAAEEKESFDKIVAILKEQGGEYGKRVLRNFIDRLERRPEIMGIKDKNGYNKALNDMLIGSLEVVTTEEDMQDENIRKLFEEINGVRNQRTQDNIDRAKKLVTAEQVKQIYDKLKGPGQGRLTLSDIQRTVEDTQTTLTKQDISRRPSQPVLKQETREAILKQTPRNEVVEETAAPQQAAAIKKESPAQGSAKKPEKKEEKAPSKKPSAQKPSATKTGKSTKTASASKDKGKTQGGSSSGGGSSSIKEQPTSNDEFVFDPSIIYSPIGSQIGEVEQRVARGGIFRPLFEGATTPQQGGQNGKQASPIKLDPSASKINLNEQPQEMDKIDPDKLRQIKSGANISIEPSIKPVVDVEDVDLGEIKEAPVVGVFKEYAAVVEEVKAAIQETLNVQGVTEIDSLKPSEVRKKSAVAVPETSSQNSEIVQ